MKRCKKYILIIILIIIVLIIRYMCKKEVYDINKQIVNYSLMDPIIKDEYMNYLKKYIKVKKLANFIENDDVAISPMKKESTGKVVIKAMEFIGYKMLFMSMFDKERKGFDDCPVTQKFKEKFKTNLLEHFNLIISDDCESDCLLNIEEQKLEVEVYGEFENTEPTKGKTYHFHYTLDDEGNVDDVIFDSTSE